MDKLKLAEQSLIHDDIPEFQAGDTVNVHYRVREGDKERIQQFEGVVISRRGSGANKTFIVRKISAGNIGVERIFPLYSPFIANIEVTKQGDVRRSKLYYLRDRRGKAARIKEKERNANAKNEKTVSKEASVQSKAAREGEPPVQEEVSSEEE